MLILYVYHTYIPFPILYYIYVHHTLSNPSVLGVKLGLSSWLRFSSTWFSNSSKKVKHGMAKNSFKWKWCSPKLISFKWKWKWYMVEWGQVKVMLGKIRLWSKSESETDAWRNCGIWDFRSGSHGIFSRIRISWGWVKKQVLMRSHGISPLLPPHLECPPCPCTGC